MEVELEWLCEAVRRHCPAFFLHPADRYLPCSAEFFLHHSELRMEVPGGSGSRLLLPRGSVAGPLLLDAQRQLPPGSRLWLELDPAARRGEPLERLQDVPVYCHPKLVVHPDGRLEAVELVYITLYAYNGAYSVGGLPFLQTGSHDGDIEHITARIHPTTGELQAVWYNAHRCRDGCWVPAPKLPRCPSSGRIAAFVALHGHGTYPAPGRVLRHFFLGNDLCSADGPVWRPRRVILLNPPPSSAAAAAAGSAAAAAGGGKRRVLMQVPSRGSRLPAELACPLSSSTAAVKQAAAAPAAAVVDATEVGVVATEVEAAAAEVEAAAAPAEVEAAEKGAAASDGSKGGSGKGSGSGSSSSKGGSGSSSSKVSSGLLPEVLTEECCAAWHFQGQWGATDAACMQAWFSRAETPVSRGALLRLFGHHWPESERV